MKKLIITLLFFNSLYAKSQSISIDLSVFWKNEKNIITKDSILIPYLKVSYINQTNQNIYFLKLTNSNNNLPDFICSSLIHYENINFNNFDYLKKSKNYNFNNEKYTVKIGSNRIFNKVWIITNDKDTAFEQDIDIVNDELNYIYESLKSTSKSILKSYTPLLENYYTNENINADSIPILFENQFVFLKKDESITDTFNLIGFMLLGGNFNFTIENDSINSYVFLDSFFNKGKNKQIYQKKELPSKLGFYNLYFGKFKTNGISLKLEGVKP